MTSKLALFKARCQSRGQSLLLARRSVETPGAAYEDPYLGGADPDSEDYPASRVLPAQRRATSRMLSLNRMSCTPNIQTAFAVQQS